MKESEFSNKVIKSVCVLGGGGGGNSHLTLCSRPIGFSVPYLVFHSLSLSDRHTCTLEYTVFSHSQKKREKKKKEVEVCFQLCLM